MATQLKVKCIDQTLILMASPVIASGDKLDDIIEFEFCAKWDGYTKTATFYQDKDNVYYSMIDNETNICTIPWEVLQKNGNLYFGVFGVKGDYVRTSQVLVYKVVEGAITEDTTPSDPTPSIYQQIVNRLGTIEGKIPSQASTTNQLADKEFVNSSIATNTATFKGTFNIVDDLGLSRTATHEQVANAIATKVTDATNNDYSFVAIPNETITTEIDQYDRYKFNGTSWAYEFTLNNSSFTAEQWDAINSGISSSDVSQITTNKSSITNLQNNKQDKLVSGTNIKTINGVSLLGEGDMETPLPIANASTLGGVKIGDGINVTDDGTISAQEYSLPTASASVKGGIKVGTNLSMNGDTLNNDYKYNLPTASSSTLGGVKVGSNLSISNGVLNASAGAFYGIDTSNKIASVSASKTSVSWTATQNCWAVGKSMVNLEPVIMTIDGIVVGQWANDSYKIEGACVPCKNGQVVKLDSSGPTYPSITAYGFK